MKLRFGPVVLLALGAFLLSGCSDAVAEMRPQHLAKAVKCFDLADWGASSEQVSSLFDREADSSEWLDFFPSSEGDTFLMEQEVSLAQQNSARGHQFLVWDDVRLFGATAQVCFEFADNALVKGFLLFSQNITGQENARGLRPRLRNLLNKEYGAANEDQGFLYWQGTKGNISMEAFKVREISSADSFGIKHAGYLLLVYSAK